MKKLISIILSLVLVLSLATVASAASITITNPANVEGETYTAYKVFDATISTDAENKEHVSYTIDFGSPFFTAVQNSGYFTLTQINSSTVYNVTKNENYDSTAAASLAATLANVSGKVSAGTATWDAESKTYTIANLPTGYYIVTSSVGSAIIVDTLKDETITSKNTYPSLTKKIVSGNDRVDTITADRGATITFEVTVNIPATAAGTITVHDDAATTLTNIELAAGTTVVTKATTVTDGCDAEFIISADTVAENLGRTVTFQYTATLYGGAATATTHKNEAWLTYSAFTSTKDDVSVYTYEVEVYKYTMNGTDKAGLAGAGFVLMNSENKYYSVDGDGVVTWVDEIGNATEYKTAADSYTVTFAGLANGTYTLVESTVPDGYNKANDVTVPIDNANKTGADQIEVLNQTGSELPSTGGIGTTIFYVVGALLMAGAAVLLVTKRRMGNV